MALEKVNMTKGEGKTCYCSTVLPALVRLESEEGKEIVREIKDQRSKGVTHSHASFVLLDQSLQFGDAVRFVLQFHRKGLHLVLLAGNITKLIIPTLP